MTSFRKILGKWEQQDRQRATFDVPHFTGRNPPKESQPPALTEGNATTLNLGSANRRSASGMSPGITGLLFAIVRISIWRHMLPDRSEESGKRPATRRADALFTKVSQQMSEDRGGGEITIRRSEKRKKRGKKGAIQSSFTEESFRHIFANC
jgi:hypothetical protein